MAEPRRICESGEHTSVLAIPCRGVRAAELTSIQAMSCGRSVGCKNGIVVLSSPLQHLTGGGSMDGVYCETVMPQTTKDATLRATQMRTDVSELVPNSYRLCWY